MHPFAYVAPSTVAEAVAVLDEHGDRARPLAGGTDLLVKARANVWELDAVVDIKNIPELMNLSVGSDGLSIGAGVPCYQVYDNSEIAAEYPGIVDGVSIIGGIQVQSRAGLGGNLCNAAPSGDGICPLIVHSAVAKISGPSGDREVAVEDFATGPSRTVLGKGELLVSIEVPKPAANSGAAYTRFIPRNEMDIAVAGVGVFVQLDSSGQNFESAQIALASVGPTPILASAAGDSLVGKPVNDETIAAAAALAKEAATPITDMRGTVDQRKQLVEVLTGRMIKQAVERARG
ncbi:FAD binding domain-containing protein [Candidatus Lucifugimonas marina]|uniref:Xanthine dehydrogenase family protein subunit M n=1 Tax=Candidatus Lucifugimonas marina TaxID=3038979 RepID=A0AAJ6CSS5_9CHLR|nr:xanthine dehydrogenase family protein subunit M [SAR202 cluster bacterium JH702]MDG0870659.1 xanthine dehydrogenase family protein subunit M [SAR202 cluster bacterium JH639]WFG36603.1 xanthine dehydrogenase family protein subunit M [SAR202 cluster bacterium JH545]WFG40536.1 xanthine dehydrogenase family protein subunit M [SAR202 cluster bacterium JH1073]